MEITSRLETIIAIICITILMAISLLQNPPINGSLLTIVVGVVAGLGGYKLAKSSK